MLAPSVIDALVASGCSVQQLAAAVKADALLANEKLLANRAAVRERVQKHRANKKAEQYQQSCNEYDQLPPVTPNVPIEEKKESKEESKKEEVSNRRVSMKRSTIPPSLVCSDRNVSDAIKLGMAESSISLEWSKFHDHHLHKGTLGKDWNAGWRRWCQNHVQWNTNKISTKNKSNAEHNEELREQLFNIADRLQDQPQVSRQLGAPDLRLVPSYPESNPRVPRYLGKPLL